MKHDIDLRFLLKAYDDPEHMVTRFIESSTDINFWNKWEDESPTIQEIEESEQRLVQHTIAINLFDSLMDELRNACFRSLGTHALTVEVEDLYTSNDVRTNIRCYREKIEQDMQSLAKFSEHILFEEPIEQEV